MKRIAYWGLPLLLISALATQGFAQDPKWKDTKEYEAYMTVFNEKDFVKKAANAEKFFTDHKDADPIALTQVYQMMILSYANAGNWSKTLDTVERMGQLAPKLSDADKMKYTQIGMVAAANLKNNAKTMEYAEKVLAATPNDFNALVTMSSVLSSETMPTQEAAKEAHLKRTLDVAKRALAVPRPQGYSDAQWNQTQIQLHQTSCLMLLNQTKYDESMAECQASLKINRKDSYPWYLIGLSQKALLVPLVKKYTDALDKYNANRDADQITLDDLKTIYQGAEQIASAKRDETLDAFATAVVLGGPAATQARQELQGLFTGTPQELDQLISNKRAQIN